MSVTTADTPAPAAPKPVAPSTPAPLQGTALIIASLALAVGTFMQVLDSTIANVSIPTIAGNLGASIDQGTWVITGFAVSNGVSVPLTGWLMQRYGVVRTFVGAVAMFTLASLLCGLAWNMPSLVVFRVIQGAVSGPMIPGSQALLLMIYPKSKQATALAIWSITTLVAPIMGPVLGGWLCDNIAWQWIFLINVPVGLACVFICWNFLAKRETPTRKLPIDRTGFALLVLWVGSLQVMLDTGKNADWFADPVIVTEAVIALIGFIAFVIWEVTAENPIVDLSLFRRPNFAIGTSIFALCYAIFFASALLQPLWLQTQMGYIATWAGLVTTPAGVVAVIFTPLVARMVSRIDVRWVATMSISGFGLSLWMRSLYGPDADFIELIIPSLVQGIGLSGFFISMITISINGVEPQNVPKASGLTNFARITAGSFAASVTTTWWDRSAALNQTRLAEITGGSTDQNWANTMQMLQERGMSVAQSAAVLGQQISHQAYFLATMELFRVSAILSFILVPFIWLTRPAKAQKGAVAAD